jgi:hypothetical protein
MERDLESASREMYVDAMLELGAVMGERRAGDPALNQERAGALQRRVLEHTTPAPGRRAAQQAADRPTRGTGRHAQIRRV